MDGIQAFGQFQISVIQRHGCAGSANQPVGLMLGRHRDLPGIRQGLIRQVVVALESAVAM